MAAIREIIDLSALRFNQISIITLVLVGFILDLRILPVFVAIVLIAGSLNPNLALFKLLYKHVARPLGILTPNPVGDSPAPHEFAQLLGGIVLAGGALVLYLDSPVAGWGLAWVVILLAAANVFFGFCAGCFVYYQLGKFGVPGFRPRSN